MKVVIGDNRKDPALMLVVSLVLVAVTILALAGGWRRDDSDRILVASLYLIFFGAYTVVATRNLIGSRPSLIIDDRGVFDRRLGVGFIPWSDIHAACVEGVGGSDYIRLRIPTIEHYLKKSPAVKLAMSRTNHEDIWLDVTYAPIGVQDLLVQIDERISSSRGSIT